MAEPKENKFCEDAKIYWQLHYAQTLTAQDGKEITQTITDFFQTLESWQQSTTQEHPTITKGKKE